ncbi:hypothetical protein [Roseateles oligotrophus]|uniref:Sec-independent protein translocase protein TatA n=1 Tax=Roseateles oligotrophus TaxID=1769250 RepID=A0ABT2YM45_9BURK|nr:hypothetical protein [Roseateles oligotrophus]MCV2371121.1 hypothetical protein [Roseateles oligotrophus]
MFGIDLGWLALIVVLLLAVAGVMRWDLLRAMGRDALEKSAQPKANVAVPKPEAEFGEPPREMHHAEQHQHPAHHKPEIHRSGKRH